MKKIKWNIFIILIIMVIAPVLLSFINQWLVSKGVNIMMFNVGFNLACIAVCLFQIIIISEKLEE